MARELRVCKVCQKDFFPEIYRSNSSIVKYCSNECRHVAKKSEMIKKKKIPPSELILYEEENETR